MAINDTSFAYGTSFGTDAESVGIMVGDVLVWDGLVEEYDKALALANGLARSGQSPYAIRDILYGGRCPW